MDDVVFLYVTAPDEAAAAIAEALVTERAAACVNILPRIQSVYRWKGSVQRSAETALIVKTTAARAPAAQRLIEQRHPYETPAIAAICVAGELSGPAFLAWIQTELGETVF